MNPDGDNRVKIELQCLSNAMWYDGFAWGIVGATVLGLGIGLLILRCQA